MATFALSTLALTLKEGALILKKIVPKTPFWEALFLLATKLCVTLTLAKTSTLPSSSLKDVTWNKSSTPLSMLVENAVALNYLAKNSLTVFLEKDVPKTTLKLNL